MSLTHNKLIFFHDFIKDLCNRRYEFLQQNYIRTDPTNTSAYTHNCHQYTLVKTAIPALIQGFENKHHYSRVVIAALSYSYRHIHVIQ